MAFNFRNDHAATSISQSFATRLKIVLEELIQELSNISVEDNGDEPPRKIQKAVQPSKSNAVLPRKKSSKCKITKNKAISSQLVLPEPKKSTSIEESYDDPDDFLTVKQEPVDFPDEELSDSAQPSTSITDENIEIKGKFPIFFIV